MGNLFIKTKFKNMKTLKVITSLLFIATSYSAKKIECPKLKCIQDNAPKADHVLGTNECF